MTAPTTLAEAIESSHVGFDVLDRSRYKPMLGIVRELIGVVPNCDPVLEIWPTGFQTYNLVVPTLLDLPKSIFGRGAPKDLVGLGLYASSRAAHCMYCSAHTCSFALRRGASEATVAGDHSPVEAAVVRLAEGLSRIPADATTDDLDELRRHLPAEDVDGVVMGVVMMGFLNKFMDAMGVGLEAASINDVEDLIEPTGWAVGQHAWNGGAESTQTRAMQVDSLSTYLRVLRCGPGATRLERRWTSAVPGDPVDGAGHLRERYGADYTTVLQALPNTRLVKAFTTLLDENLSAANRTIELDTKGAAALVYATVAGNEVLERQARELVSHATGDDDAGRLDALAAGDTGADLLLDLAVAFAPSPAQVTPDLVTRAAAELTPQQIVELAVWISIQQMLHRLERYRALTNG